MLSSNEYKDFLDQAGDFGITAFDFSGENSLDLSRHFKSNHHGYFVITEGNAIQIIDFEEHFIKRGRILRLRKNQLYTWRKVNSLKGYMVLFTDEYISKIASSGSFGENDMKLNNTIPAFVILNEEKLSDWTQLIQKMEREKSLEKVMHLEILDHYLSILNILFVREASGSGGYSSDRKKMLVNQFVSLVNQHFLEYKTPKPYAGLLNITPNYLNSICNEVLDKKAGEVIQDRLILEAKRMLAHSEITVAALATHLGFNDNSYFGRYFRKASGLPPEQFRKSFPDF